MKLPGVFKKLSRLIVPRVPTGGLQISSSSIRFMEFIDDAKGKKVKEASLRLPPGIIELGRVKDRENFIRALKNIHSQVEPKASKNVNAVVTIPAGDVYVQSFSLPNLAGDSLSEAIELNMKAISPNPIEKSYYSSKVIGRGLRQSGEAELLGAFVDKDVIDNIVSCLGESGFAVAAIEFSSLSLARILESNGTILKDRSYLVIKLTQDGLIFVILRNNNLYFNYFHSWDQFSEQGISVDSIKSIIFSEGQRVMNFYTSRLGGQVDEIKLVTPVFGEELSAKIKERYPNIEVSILDSQKENFHGVVGAAIRGKLPRLEDNDINLMDPSSMSSFYRDQIINFIAFWRNILVTSGLFMLAVFFASNIFLESQAKLVEEKSTLGRDQSETAELAGLRAKANEFNSMVASLSELKKSIKNIYPFVAKLNETAASRNIKFARFDFNVENATGSIDGSAANQDAINGFRSDLEAISWVKEVNLPFHRIVTGPDKNLIFPITFKIAI